MTNTPTIRTELEAFIKRRGLNISQLGKEAGLNAGTVSSILKGNRVMAVDQLDRMTAVLALPQGYYYEQYIQECMVEAVPNWRRIRPLLYRCAELDKLDCIRQIVLLLLDNLTYSPLLFEVAEDFLNQGRKASAALLYESVANSERRQHSERLAFCQYRLFTLRLGDDQEQNLQAALQFEPFVDRLDEIDQLDALRDLANTYRSLQRWDKVDKVAEEMGNLARIQISLTQQPRSKRQELHKKPQRPLFVYVALSDLFRGSVCDARGDYEQALQYDYAYADLSWVQDKDEDTLHWLTLFKEWAQANIKVSRLMFGDQSVLPEYVDYIKSHNNEKLAGILNILKSANKSNFDVDYILQYFESEISSLIQQKQLKAVGVYSKELVSDQIGRLLYELAHYYLKKYLYFKGFDYLLQGLEKFITLNNETFILKCVRLFENYREFANSEILFTYRNLLKGGDEYEKKIGVAVNGA
ncbi:helix-turn-helix transcriptional regulator [Paenibacillus albidus]|uniref:helix-turn-helix domain-containing protein n=1 Tax=Paenibacillus albidus TaxID=2041023 RepID=UPI001BE70783|nr:helix-turn-helix transcriptional regulator [Paenibacillus albidus]MBT2289108.1 helix-turn-helix transcriptional regulator [Paenibacillus albidus]